jgi:hypothetical protein
VYLYFDNFLLDVIWNNAAMNAVYSLRAFVAKRVIRRMSSNGTTQPDISQNSDTLAVVVLSEAFQAMICNGRPLGMR